MARHRRGRHRRPSPLPVKAVRVIVGAGGLGVFGWLWGTDVTETPIPEFQTVHPSSAADPLPLITTGPATTVSAPPLVTEPEVAPTRPPPVRTTTKKPQPTPAEPEPDEDDEEEGDGQDIVDSARSFLGRGIPYVYGGKTLAGMDCSGYIWRVLQKAGYDEPYRTSSALKRWAIPISASEARPGDLVFWPGHAAIYAGEGRIYDSGSTSFGVTERDMWGGATFGRVPSGSQ